MGFGKKRGGKSGRGGGARIQIQNIEELELRNAAFEAQKADRRARRGDSDDDSSDGGEADVTSKPTPKAKESVFDMEKVAKAVPQKSIKNKDMAAAQAAAATEDPTDRAKAGMNKKEREAYDSNAAREAYMQRTLAGETDEAKRNLAKLQEVRRRREEAKKQREAAAAGETATPAAGTAKPKAVQRRGDDSDSDDSDSDEESSDEEESMAALKAKTAAKVEKKKKSEAAAKKKAKAMAAEAAAAEDSAACDLPKLTSIEIKKMNPAAIKDALKERGESTQGQKKDLITRLTAFEAARA